MTPYAEKFARIEGQTLFSRLNPSAQSSIRELAARYRFTLQELRQVCEAALDLHMWGEEPLHVWWGDQEEGLSLRERARKEHLFRALRGHMETLRAAPKRYPGEGMGKPAIAPLRRVLKDSARTVMGPCPVASEETICCNLRTLDAVENCGFGCSYCTIQTFYEDAVAFDPGLAAKLEGLQLDPGRFYHVGTGQSSDALLWGNQCGLLDALCAFGKKWPRVILELKTKSKNVSYLLRNQIPGNIFPSWSINAPTIIRNEEHFTADLEERLEAARRAADAGYKVAFHLHPIVYFANWETEYGEVVARLVDGFLPEEVLFVSLGTLTFIRPVVRAIRQRAWQSKILQMELVPGAKGKLTYPDLVKEMLFDQAYRAFAPWHAEVYFYLCMEPARFWTSVLGHAYPSNDAFEQDLIGHLRAKLRL